MVVGKNFALPVNNNVTSKLVKKFYRFLPFFTGKNAQLYMFPSFELMSLLMLIAFSFLNYHDIFNETSLAQTYFQVPYTGEPGY